MVLITNDFKHYSRILDKRRNPFFDCLAFTGILIIFCLSDFAGFTQIGNQGDRDRPWTDSMLLLPTKHNRFYRRQLIALSA